MLPLLLLILCIACFAILFSSVFSFGLLFALQYTPFTWSKSPFRIPIRDASEFEVREILSPYLINTGRFMPQLMHIPVTSPGHTLEYRIVRLSVSSNNTLASLRTLGVFLQILRSDRGTETPLVPSAHHRFCQVIDPNVRFDDATVSGQV